MVETKIEIDEIIKMAENFECCPYCGNPNLKNEHFCDVCKERIVEPCNAHWFAEYLKKKRNIMKTIKHMDRELKKKINSNKPRYKPFRCKIGFHHWHYFETTQFSHILRCALCGKTKLIQHTWVVLEIEEKKGDEKK